MNLLARALSGYRAASSQRTVRIISPLPLRDRDPRPGDLFAPRYDFDALQVSPDELRGVRDPYGPDPVVFGPPDCRDLQRGGSSGDGQLRSCTVHSVTWRGKAACWLCGGRRP